MKTESVKLSFFLFNDRFFFWSMKAKCNLFSIRKKVWLIVSVRIFMTPLIESVQKGEVYEPKQSTGMCWKQAIKSKATVVKLGSLFEE